MLNQQLGVAHMMSQQRDAARAVAEAMAAIGPGGVARLMSQQRDAARAVAEVMAAVGPGSVARLMSQQRDAARAVAEVTSAVNGLSGQLGDVSRAAVEVQTAFSQQLVSSTILEATAASRRTLASIRIPASTVAAMSAHALAKPPARPLILTGARSRGEVRLRPTHGGTEPERFVSPYRGRVSLRLFDELVTDVSVRRASRHLFADGHYAVAVEKALVCVNNTVKDKSGLCDADGEGLMRTAFSAKKPMLIFNNLETTSEKNEQRGYMDLYAGAMAGIRNPRAHEHDQQDHPRVALELLTFANHLMRKLHQATRTRNQTGQSRKS